MKNKYLFSFYCIAFAIATTFGQGPKFTLDFEASDALSNLPNGVSNVNGTNTVRVKNSTDYPAMNNAVQDDPDASGEKELFLDFHGYLKVNVDNPSNGYSLVYDYRRNDANDDWWLGFLTFIGSDGTDNKLEQLVIREWDGQLNFGEVNTGGVKPIGFFTNYHIVVTVSSIGDLVVYVNGSEVLNVPNSVSGKNLHTWTNASLLMSFKGNSFDGTNVTPEPDYASNARDARAFVDNVSLYERTLSPTEVNQLLYSPAKFFINFETPNALTNLPNGVSNVNGTNTVRVKNSTNYPAMNNVVQDDPDASGEKELFLDFHGYLKVNVDNPSNGYSLVYDYRRNDANDDWWLGFLTFIGNDGADNKLEQLLIREWDGQLNFGDVNTGSVKPIGFFSNYHVVVTVSSIGDLKVYVNGSEVLNVPNSTSGKNLHTWTNASLLMSFKGNSFDGTNVTPEPDYASNARDARAFIDNVALFTRQISSTEVTNLYTNGNNSLGVLSNAEVTLLDNEIKVYPNPINSSNSELRISSDEVKHIEIYNVLGAKVLSRKIANSIVNIDSLSAGTFFVRLFDESGKNVKNTKIIKL